MGGATGLGVLLLAADESEKTFRHGERRGEKRQVVVDLGVSSQVVEKTMWTFSVIAGSAVNSRLKSV